MRVRFDLNALREKGVEEGMFKPNVTLDDIDLDRVYDCIRSGISKGEKNMSERTVDNINGNINGNIDGNETVINLAGDGERKAGKVVKFAVAAAACVGIVIGGAAIAGRMGYLKGSASNPKSTEKSTDKSKSEVNDSETVYTFVKGKGIYDSFSTSDKVYELKNSVAKEVGDYRYTLKSAYADKDGAVFNIYISQVSQDGTGYDINPVNIGESGGETHIDSKAFADAAGLAEMSSDGLSGKDTVAIDYNGKTYSFDGNYVPGVHTSVYTRRNIGNINHLYATDYLGMGAYVLSVNMDFKDNMDSIAQDNMPAITELNGNAKFVVKVLGQEFDVELKACERTNDLKAFNINKSNDAYSFLPIITKNDDTFELELYTLITGEVHKYTNFSCSSVWLDVDGEKITLNNDGLPKAGYCRFTGKTDKDLSKAKFHIGNAKVTTVIDEDNIAFDMPTVDKSTSSDFKFDNSVVSVGDISAKAVGNKVYIYYKCKPALDTMKANIDFAVNCDNVEELIRDDAKDSNVVNKDGYHTQTYVFSGKIPSDVKIQLSSIYVTINPDEETEDGTISKENTMTIDCVMNK